MARSIARGRGSLHKETQRLYQLVQSHVTLLRGYPRRRARLCGRRGGRWWNHSHSTIAMLLILVAI